MGGGCEVMTTFIRTFWDLSESKAKAAEAKTPEEKQAAGKAVMEATKAAILKADASLESVFKALEEARGKGKGKGDKGGKKPEAK